jgi:peptide/nickel transport system substrate-binding protein
MRFEPQLGRLLQSRGRQDDRGAVAGGDPDRRKQILWAIERKLAEDNARPIIFYNRNGTCEQPYVKGLTIMVNSIFNGWRMEDVWLDK